MPYTLYVLQLLNLIAGGITFYVYQYRINLWHDQGLIIFSLMGVLLSGLILLSIGMGILTRSKLAGGLRILHLLVSLPLFCGQFLCLGYAIWIKTY